MVIELDLLLSTLFARVFRRLIGSSGMGRKLVPQEVFFQISDFRSLPFYATAFALAAQRRKYGASPVC